MKPLGTYLISDFPEGGLIREGAYSLNQMTRIYLVAIQFFYHIFCRINIQFFFTTQIRKFNTVFIPNDVKVNMQGCFAKSNIW